MNDFEFADRTVQVAAAVVTVAIIVGAYVGLLVSVFG